MPDWSSPLEIFKDEEIFRKLCLVILGLSTWEIINQLPFDWSIVSRKRDAYWPAFFYFYCKYSVWLAVVGVNIFLNVTSEVNCQRLYVFNQFAGNTAIGSTSTLLMLRTIAVWNRAHRVTAPLVVASLGQWGLLIHGIATVRSSWSDVSKECVINGALPVAVGLIYLYTMTFDFIVLLLTTIGLVRSRYRSSLGQLLFHQGIVYFLVAFVANMLPAIFLLLNLNPLMNIMFTIPAAVASSIVACRSFASLTSFRQKDTYVDTASPNIETRLGSGHDHYVSGNPGSSNEDSSMKKKGSKHTIAGISFRRMSAGVDSMAPDQQPYSMDELDFDSAGATNTVVAAPMDDESKPAYDFGGATTETTVVYDYAYDSAHVGGVHVNVNVNVVDLESAETPGYGYWHGQYDGQRSFVPGF